MSKPMLVTWPFVLLLLDYWPLERFNRESAWRLVTERLPFLALAVVVSVVTFVVQKRGGALGGAAEALPLGVRGGNALISYCRYLGKLFWPTDLAVFYPHPGYWPLARVLLAGGLIAGVSVLLFVERRRYPFLLMGWLWFCGTLVPVIGLVQMGVQQAMADRYAYIPSLGVLVLAVWGVCELTKSWHYRVVALTVAGSAAFVLCLALTRQQLGYWKDGEALFRHALGVTEDNYLAHLNLGSALDEKGQIDEAIREFQEAIRLKPDYVLAHLNLGVALVKKGQFDEGTSQYHEAIRLKPDYAEAHSNLGLTLFRKGQADQAIREFQEAIRVKPDFAEARNNLGMALDRKGQTDEAFSEFEEAIRLKPNFAEAHSNLGLTLVRKGQFEEAIRKFQEAIRLKPDFAEAHYDLGIALARKGQLDEAIREFQAAIRLKPDFAEARNSLARALAITNAPAGR
jgi:Flp pilus assembly protein TadD